MGKGFGDPLFLAQLQTEMRAGCPVRLMVSTPGPRLIEDTPPRHEELAEKRAAGSRRELRERVVESFGTGSVCDGHEASPRFSHKHQHALLLAEVSRLGRTSSQNSGCKLSDAAESTNPNSRQQVITFEPSSSSEGQECVFL